MIDSSEETICQTCLETPAHFSRLAVSWMSLIFPSSCSWTLFQSKCPFKLDSDTPQHCFCTSTTVRVPNFSLRCDAALVIKLLWQTTSITAFRITLHPQIPILLRNSGNDSIKKVWLVNRKQDRKHSTTAPWQSILLLPPYLIALVQLPNRIWYVSSRLRSHTFPQDYFKFPQEDFSLEERLKSWGHEIRV